MLHFGTVEDGCLGWWMNFRGGIVGFVVRIGELYD